MNSIITRITKLKPLQLEKNVTCRKRGEAHQTELSHDIKQKLSAELFQMENHEVFHFNW